MSTYACRLNTTVLLNMDAGKDKHPFYDFGLSVPADAEIQGIVVRLDARAASAPGANNGGSTFWLDGNQQFSYANIRQ